jgi:hypothetical protein
MQVSGSRDRLLAANPSGTMRRICNAKELPMKTTTFPPLRVEAALWQAAEDVLHEGESLSSFVERSIRENIERRQNQREFIARGLHSRDAARRTRSYVKSDVVIGRFEKILAHAKTSAKARK